MPIAGMFLKANEVRVVTLSGSRSSHQLVSPKVNKLALIKNPSQSEVIQFAETIRAYCVEHKIEQIVLNRRATSGQGAGGAGTILNGGGYFSHGADKSRLCTSGNSQGNR